ncbi:SpvB/TcaC N-terminal domain-containing protein [Pseudanabaena sp. PCC 6802]|uniref:SpvB/TcaC N-terminal domain-containing protein n=1 Tax=Pseudanabaena sp. PCC 6802 TaxID=118173 RepID=UPI000344AEE4|nr:SpvB/TcaC N-terminal domain-containing protein [Pseudanabaena sp. PCC 6802]
MSNKISATQVSLPKGGGAIQGIGETFQSDEFTGTASLSIPIPTSPCRGFEPKLSVEYSSGAGNGIFGLGFGLSIPNISRKTSKGIPTYDESDTFLISNAEDLVPIDGGQRHETANNATYQVTTYQPRLEGLFARIEHWCNTASDGDSYWRVTSKDNITSIFGKDETARIVDPDSHSHIFQWLLSETFEATGDRIVYEYESENDDNLPADAIYEVNRTQSANKYIKTIKYGNVQPFQEGKVIQDNWMFEVVFDYGEYNLDATNAKPYTPVQKWLSRQDPFSTYHAGFEIRTHRLCRNVLMFHRFKELGSDAILNPVLVHATQFTYTEDSHLTLLAAVTSTGYRHENGKYQTKSVPPLEFKYTAFQPDKQAFEPLLGGNGQSLPGLNLSPDYLLIDLYGEGIPGILYNDGRTTLYWEPEGDGNGQGTSTTVRYAPPLVPLTLPIESDRQKINQRLMDLTGDGQLDLVVSTPASTGYYEANPDRTWNNFQTFPAFPNDFSNPNNYLVDVTGDGLADILLVESDRIWVYPSLGKDGFGAPSICLRDKNNDLPLTKQSGANEVIQFADLLGSGQQHLARITNGKVECWPNLGYGKFGKPVQLDNAPKFEGDLDASRLFLADLDGSGTADLIYVYPDRVEVFFNQSGNSFKDPVSITLPSTWDRLAQIEFADIHGNGTTCLVFSETHPEPRHWCYDFSGTQKPYLLNEIDNNLGAKSTITYSSSTKFYLADKKKGTPWIVNLPFPVLVVEKTESFDLISQTKLVSTYSYHHGFYDGIEREFRGFGMVERQDAETLSANAQLTDVPPVLTKTWYHTGAWQQNGSLSRQYEREYFQGDTQAHLLPDSAVDYSVYTGGKPDDDAQREAFRALKGTVLREEVFAIDNSSLQSNPYTVSETNYRVRLLQPQGSHKYGVYFVHPQETLTYHYERNHQDPRIQHDFVLEITPFGNVLKACSVSYGRRADANITVYPEQTQLKATVQLGEFIEITEPFRLIGVPYEQKALEINGLDLQGQQYFSLDAIQEQINGALKQQVAYGVPFSDNALKSRLISWQQSYFWHEHQEQMLPLGQITAQALLHHQQEAVFSNEWLQSVYGNKLDQTILSRDGGYFQEDNGYWWNKGLVQHYFKLEGFYLSWQTKNDFAEQAAQADGLQGKMIVSYDSYYLLPIKTEAYLTDTEKNVTTASIDYHNLAPWQLTDENGVIHQVLFDPLGMAIATSIFKEATDGSSREGDGDLSQFKIPIDATFDKILAQNLSDKELDKNLADYLQKATSFFYYDLLAWKERQQPVNHISLVRQTHVSDLKSGEQSVIQVSVGYADGFGRAIEQKLLVEPGEAILRDEAGNLQRDENGQPVRGEILQRWLVSGRTVYNNKGNPAEQYLPYFSNTALYETQSEIVAEKLVPPPTVMHYDPLLRVIRVDTPKSFFSKVEFTAWETKHYDRNDTVKDSAYYKKFIDNYPANPTEEQKNEKDALDKAAVFYNTPQMMVLDSMGNAFLEIQNNLGAVSEEAFKDIVSGDITSKAVWDLLITKGYLSKAEGNTQAWVTSKFRPYSSDFKPAFISDMAQPFAEEIIDLLRQNCLTSYHKYDTQGRLIESIDPRLYHANQTQGTAYYNFKYQYAMGEENPAATDSADAGLDLSLNNIFGSFLWIRSARNFDQVIAYDRFQRKTKIRIKGLKNDGTVATDNIVETYTYGETHPQSQACNLRGQLYQHQDQSGQIINGKYNIQGQLLETTRQFTQEYKDYINWETVVNLETESPYKHQFAFNALQQLITETTPDGSITTNTYNLSGLLDRVSVKFPDGTLQPIINRIEYNQNQQRVAVAYGNGVNTTYTYEDTTLHLIKLFSTRLGKDATGKDRPTVLQDITYTYDPVGNITRLLDRSHETIFYNNQKVEPLSEYTYDALYRLIEANGRQHPGINGATYKNNEKDGDFKQSKFMPLVNDANKLENYTESYTYDEAGNLITTAHRATNAWTRSQEIMPDSNRLKTIRSGNGVNDAQDVSYDNSGNMRQFKINSNVSLTWSCCDNLVKVGIIQRPDEMDDSNYYTYDSNEMRTRKVSERMANGGAIVWKEEKRYLGNYEEKFIKNVTQNGEATILKRQTLIVMGVVIHYWEQDDSQREVDKAGTRSLRYQLGNHLGSVSLEVDNDAQIISYEEYFPYGGTALIAGRNQKEVKLKEYRYSGKERDDSTGLYYYGARYYAPWLGRWMNPDPAGTVDGLNVYAFVGGNPTSFVDLTGMNISTSNFTYLRPQDQTVQYLIQDAQKIHKKLRFRSESTVATSELSNGTYIATLNGRGSFSQQQIQNLSQRNFNFPLRFLKSKELESNKRQTTINSGETKSLRVAGLGNVSFKIKTNNSRLKVWFSGNIFRKALTNGKGELSLDSTVFQTVVRAAKISVKNVQNVQSSAGRHTVIITSYPHAETHAKRFAAKRQLRVQKSGSDKPTCLNCANLHEQAQTVFGDVTRASANWTPP